MKSIFEIFVLKKDVTAITAGNNSLWFTSLPSELSLIFLIITIDCG